MAKQQKLGRHVTVAGTTYGPGDNVPADIAAKIRNPKAWLPADQDEVEEDQADHKAGTASGHKLATAVTVGARTYGPRDFIPDDVAAQIRNPKAWQDGKLPSLAPKAASTSAESERAAADGDGDSADAEIAGEAKTPRKAAAPAAAKRV